MLDLSLPSGLRDLTPDHSAHLADLSGRLQAVFSSFGYRRVLLPTLERLEVVERERISMCGVLPATALLEALAEGQDRGAASAQVVEDPPSQRWRSAACSAFRPGSARRWPPSPARCAAASRAIGTRNGEQDT